MGNKKTEQKNKGRFNDVNPILIKDAFFNWQYKKYEKNALDPQFIKI